MEDIADFTYGFVGLGLMGGSLAKAIRNFIISPEGKGKILATDCRIQTLEEAKKNQVIDDFYSVEETREMLKQCDMVYICLYPKATKEFLKTNIDSFKPGAIITDIAGVKTELLEAFPEGLKADENLSADLKSHKFDENPPEFIPGHPMAGSEKEGYIHSNGSIFNGRNYILLPYKNTNQTKLECLKEIITRIGFTNIIITDSSTHDHKIAFTSQLCHIIASALVESAEDTDITQFGGGSFEDLTRIAMINAPLWTELFLSNKKELLGHIESFQSSLEEIKNMIVDSDSKKLQEKLELVRSKRTLMIKNG